MKRSTFYILTNSVVSALVVLTTAMCSGGSAPIAPAAQASSITPIVTGGQTCSGYSATIQQATGSSIITSNIIQNAAVSWVVTIVPGTCTSLYIITKGGQQIAVGSQTSITYSTSYATLGTTQEIDTLEPLDTTGASLGTPLTFSSQAFTVVAPSSTTTTPIACSVVVNQGAAPNVFQFNVQMTVVGQILDVTNTAGSISTNPNPTTIAAAQSISFQGTVSQVGANPIVVTVQDPNNPGAIESCVGIANVTNTTTTAPPPPTCQVVLSGGGISNSVTPFTVSVSTTGNIATATIAAVGLGPVPYTGPLTFTETHNVSFVATVIDVNGNSGQCGATETILPNGYVVVGITGGSTTVPGVVVNQVLVKQISQTLCVLWKNFGWHPGSDQVFETNGCNGEFGLLTHPTYNFIHLN